MQLTFDPNPTTDPIDVDDRAPNRFEVAADRLPTAVATPLRRDTAVATPRGWDR